MRRVLHYRVWVYGLHLIVNRGYSVILLYNFERFDFNSFTVSYIYNQTTSMPFMTLITPNETR